MGKQRKDKGNKAEEWKDKKRHQKRTKWVLGEMAQVLNKGNKGLAKETCTKRKGVDIPGKKVINIIKPLS